MPPYQEYKPAFPVLLLDAIIGMLRWIRIINAHALTPASVDHEAKIKCPFRKLWLLRHKQRAYVPTAVKQKTVYDILYTN